MAHAQFPASLPVTGTGGAQISGSGAALLTSVDTPTAIALPLGATTATSVVAGKSGVQLQAPGGLDQSTAAALSIGVTNATAVNIGKAAVPVAAATGATAGFDCQTAAVLSIGATTATAVNIGKAAVPALAATGATAGFDCQTAAALTIGGTNATGVTIGKAAVNTTLGAKLNVPTGAAGIAGTAVLVAGTVTVSTTAVTASSIIPLTRQVAGGTVGDLRLGTITAGTSFVINSASATDTSTIGWFIIN